MPVGVPSNSSTPTPRWFGSSRTSDLASRFQPGLEEAFELIKAGAADAFMAKDLNRISRHAGRTLAFADELDQQGAALCLAGPDGATGARPALWVLSLLAEAEGSLVPQR